MRNPVYADVLLKLTPEKINKELRRVKKIELPERINKWIERYKVIGDRDKFIWLWLYTVNKRWTYIDVIEDYKDDLTEVKLLYNMFIVLLDDIAEEKGKEDLLGILLKIPLNTDYQVSKLDKASKQYFEFAMDVWTHILRKISDFPNYKEHKDLFEYDTRQFLNAVRYANLIYRKPYLLNSKEFWLYLPHSMQILIDFDIDMMCIDSVEEQDIGQGRHAALLIQEMGRIGNWLSTWEREVRSNDYTSLVVSQSYEDGIITKKEIVDNKNDTILKKIKKSSTEKKILGYWEDRYSKLLQIGRKTKVINTTKISKNARYLLFMHLLSRGYK